MSLFLAIVEAGSITRAAEKLALSKSVLSQHLKQLETELSTLLLKRTTRRQSLTDAGKHFYQHCCQMQILAEQAWNEVLEQQLIPKGRVTVTAPHALMNTIVIPAFTKTFSGNENISLNLICNDYPLDLMEHEIDLAIRVGESKDSNYRQKRIGIIREVLCKLKGNNYDLSRAGYISNHWESGQDQHYIKSLNVALTVKHNTNTIDQTVALIEAGMGLGTIPEILLSSHPNLETVEIRGTTNVYALHSYSSSIPVAIKLAQQAIEDEFSSRQD